MTVKTTYTCDGCGVTGEDRHSLVEVSMRVNLTHKHGDLFYSQPGGPARHFCLDCGLKYKLIYLRDEPTPDPTPLETLLREIVAEEVTEALANQ